MSSPDPKFSPDVSEISKNSTPSVRESAELAGSPPWDSLFVFDTCSIDSSSKTTTLLVNAVPVSGSQSLNPLTPVVKPMNLHFLVFASNLFLLWLSTKLYAGQPNIRKVE